MRPLIFTPTTTPQAYKIDAQKDHITVFDKWDLERLVELLENRKVQGARQIILGK